MALLISGLFSTLLGFVVLVGWYTHNTTLIQVLPSFVPMQYNTAVGFFLSGLGPILVSRGRFLVARCIGLLVTVVGFLTLIEYIFGVDLGIDQLIMEHYVNVKTSHPGRMAPNTALCFLLSGASVVILSRVDWAETGIRGSGVLGSATAGLGAVALFGYISGLETTYGWGHLTRMAVHTSIGFIDIGVGLLVSSILLLRSKEGGYSTWLVWPVAISSLTSAIVLWRSPPHLRKNRRSPFLSSSADSFCLRC